LQDLELNNWQNKVKQRRIIRSVPTHLRQNKSLFICKHSTHIIKWIYKAESGLSNCEFYNAFQMKLFRPKAI